VELQLAQMKAELNPAAAAPSGELGAGNAAGASDEPADGELVHDAGAHTAPADPFTLDDSAGAS
jgi:hypothetical protein